MNSVNRMCNFRRGRAVPLLVLVYLIAAWMPSAVVHALPSFAQPGQLPAIDATIQNSIIERITAALNKAYVFADKAAAIDSLLHANLTAGTYRDLTDPVLFSRRLREDMLSVCNDRHLGIAAFHPSESKPDNPEDSLRLAEQEKEELRKSNYGFKKVEILPGNIGLLEFTGFMDVEWAGETAVGAMNFLANVDALIIDLRQNGGGSASMIQLLTGYFFQESEHLVSWYNRATDETIQSYSQAYVPGKRMLGVPLYILTSRNTFSAAEEFTYDLMNLKRATIIGDTTGGGAHTVSDTLFDFGQFQIGLVVPSGRALSPITKTNWEGIGVAPDIAVPADQALLTAKLEAIKNLLGQATDERQKATLTWTQVSLENELHPYNLAVKDFKQYTGMFGPRRIFLEGSVLQYQREGRPKYRLVPMGKDLFGAVGLDYFRLKFSRDDKGSIDGLVGLYDDGRQDRNEKTK